MTAPLISVVIPTYNRAHVIRECIDSVLAQTYEDFEIIVVDDASTDRTPQVISQIDDPRIRLIAHAVNKGGSAARNTGLDAARGRYVALLDSDDLWFPDKLERQVQLMERFGGTESVVYSRYLYQTPTVTNQSTDIPKSPDQPVGDYLASHPGGMHIITTLIPTSAARRVRFNECLPALQDVDFLLRLETEISNFIFQPRAQAVYRIFEEASHVSQSLDYETLESWLEEVEHLLSPRAIAHFQANVIGIRALVSADRLKGARYLFEGHKHGVLGPGKKKVGLALLLLPRRLVRLIAKLKGSQIKWVT